MLHISSMWDIGRSRNTSCYLSPLTYLEMQYLILVRCRIAVHLWNAFAPSLFRRRFFVCGPLLRLSQVRRAQGGGVVLSGRRQRSRPSRSFHEKAVELSFWDWSGRIACTNWLRGMVPLYHGCNYADSARFPSRLCWADDRSLLRRTFAAIEVSPTQLQ